MTKAKHLYRFWVVGHISSLYAEGRGLKDLEKVTGRKRGDRLNEMHTVHDLGRCQPEQTDKEA